MEPRPKRKGMMSEDGEEDENKKGYGSEERRMTR